MSDACGYVASSEVLWLGVHALHGGLHGILARLLHRTCTAQRARETGSIYCTPYKTYGGMFQVIPSPIVQLALCLCHAPITTPSATDAVPLVAVGLQGRRTLCLCRLCRVLCLGGVLPLLLLLQQLLLVLSRSGLGGVRVVLALVLVLRLALLVLVLVLTLPLASLVSLAPLGLVSLVLMLMLGLVLVVAQLHAVRHQGRGRVSLQGGVQGKPDQYI